MIDVLCRFTGSVRAAVIMSGSTIAAASALVVLGPVAAVTAEAKTPGSTYCFYRTCHRVKTIAETEALVGTKEVLEASHYDDCKRDRYNPCGLTSSGEPFRSDQTDNAASPIYPDGTTLLLWSPVTQDAAVVRVNNAGPYWGKRKLDVSRATAAKLGFEKSGTAKIEVRVLSAPTKEEATYKRNRSYRPVPGYIGKYANTEMANAGASAVMAVEQVVVALLSPLTGEAKVAVNAAPAAAPKSQPATPEAVKSLAMAVASADEVGETKRPSRTAAKRRANAERYAMHTKKRAGRYAVASRSSGKKGTRVAEARMADARGSEARTRRNEWDDAPAQYRRRADEDYAPRHERRYEQPRYEAPRYETSRNYEEPAHAWSAPKGPAFSKFGQRQPQAAAVAPLRRTSWRSYSVANRS